MGTVVGNQVPCALHLDDKQHARFVSLLPGLDQALEMTYAPFRWRVRKAADPVLLQGDSLDLQKTPTDTAFHIKIKARSSKSRFPADDFRTSDSWQAERSTLQSFFNRAVGRLGIQIDQPVPFLYGNEGIGCFSLFGSSWFQPDFCSRQKKLRASSGILDVNTHRFIVVLAERDKTVWPGQKNCRHGFPILQTGSSFP